jgi:hypothetical protein
MAIIILPTLSICSFRLLCFVEQQQSGLKENKNGGKKTIISF